MAVGSKKEKLVEEAQKFALRGQFDKAAKIYEQIMVLEPATVSLRQKFAELLIKCGRVDDGRKELETIGAHFSKNGFYMKAIAVYKQLQKLFPTDISLSLILAELNEKQGLVANALSEYKLVFDFYEKTGDNTEARNILDRMHHIDPQNIPILIKRAEASAQSGNKDAAHAAFLAAASVLIERGDKVALAKVCTRVQQLFPDTTEFMFEVLTDQVTHGKAATAIDSIQNLLRSNPGNKRSWDLVVQAYQQLEQPQRVKIAYQHYLKFFPTEPTAMLGLISSAVSENDVRAAVELLDLYEAHLITHGCLPQLEQIYHTLDKIDPINVRVLEGLLRVVTASGNEYEVRSLTSKLQLLNSVSDPAPSDITSPDPPEASLVEFSVIADEVDDSSFFEECPPEQALAPAFLPFEDESDISEIDIFDASTDGITHYDEDIEIEIDLDAPFGTSDQQEGAASVFDSPLDSGADAFDTIGSTPRGVKFSNEMENSDAQSHFDLGQAFKEMGLYDEAINEFRQASLDPARRVECLTMQGACLRDHGEIDKSIALLQSLLQPGLDEREMCAVKYELASGYEAAGRKEEARTLLNEVNAAHPGGFRDISSRLNTDNTQESLDFSDEDLKNF